MDAVFRALADPTRRSLLDELFKADGQTLSVLEQRLPMTRFGVMKHLRVLEEAGLVTTQRRGREKLHFLNPVPIRLVHDRWVSKYAEPWAAALSELKRNLEGESMEKVFEVWIRATPERIWEAISDNEIRKQYSFNPPAGMDESEFAVGETVEEDPPRRLVQTMKALWSPEVAQYPATTITYEIAPRGDMCQLRVIHSGLTEDMSAEIWGGWPMILSSLKSLLETGESLNLQIPPEAIEEWQRAKKAAGSAA
jgi:DNA-binding transcriptional ArsR family regulator